METIIEFIAILLIYAGAGIQSNVKLFNKYFWFRILLITLGVIILKSLR